MNYKKGIFSRKLALLVVVGVLSLNGWFISKTVVRAEGDTCLGLGYVGANDWQAQHRPNDVWNECAPMDQRDGTFNAYQVRLDNRCQLREKKRITDPSCGPTNPQSDESGGQAQEGGGGSQNQGQTRSCSDLGYHDWRAPHNPGDEWYECLSNGNANYVKLGDRCELKELRRNIELPVCRQRVFGASETPSPPPPNVTLTPSPPPSSTPSPPVSPTKAPTPTPTPTPDPRCENNKGRMINDFVRAECDATLEKYVKIELWCDDKGYTYEKAGRVTTQSCTPDESETINPDDKNAGKLTNVTSCKDGFEEVEGVCQPKKDKTTPTPEPRRVTITITRDGEVLAGAAVEIGGDSYQTDDQGQIEVNLSPGSQYALTVNQGEGGLQTLNFEVAENSDEITLDLSSQDNQNNNEADASVGLGGGETQESNNLEESQVDNDQEVRIIPTFQITLKDRNGIPVKASLRGYDSCDNPIFTNNTDENGWVQIGNAIIRCNEEEDNYNFEVQGDEVFVVLEIRPEGVDSTYLYGLVMSTTESKDHEITIGHLDLSAQNNTSLNMSIESEEDGTVSSIFLPIAYAEAGAVIPGVQVTVTDQQTGRVVLITQSDQYGKVNLVLPAGKQYEITVSTPGYQVVKTIYAPDQPGTTYTTVLKLKPGNQQQIRSIELKPKLVKYTWRLVPGWNLVGWPVKAEPISLDQLLKRFNKNKITIIKLAYLVDNNWEIILVNVDNKPDFILQPGQAYFIQSTSYSTVSFKLEEKKTSFDNWTKQVPTGNWQAVAVPVGSVNTASGVVSAFDAARVSLSSYQSLRSAWLSYIKEGSDYYGLNYPIELGRGYLILVNDK